MEGTPFGANIGAELAGLQLQEQERPKIPEVTPPVDTAVAPASVPVRPATTEELRFCAINMVGIDKGSAGTIFPPPRPKKGEKSTWINPRGWLVIGPSNRNHDSVSYKGFLDSLQGYRWWLNVGKLYRTKERKIVWQNPSIVEDHIEECACSRRDCTWKDVKTYQETCVLAEAKQFACPTCGSRIVTRRLFTSVLPSGRPNQKEIFKSPDDEALQEMHIRICQTEPTPSELLPRIWALYPIGGTPFDWAPTDEKVKELNDRCVGNETHKGIGKTVRPFKTARTINFSKADGNHRIDKWIMEVHDSLQFGWVRITDLCAQSIEGTTGYTRRFGFEPNFTSV